MNHSAATTFEKLETILTEGCVGYLRFPYPHPIDEAAKKFIESLSEASIKERENAIRNLNNLHYQILTAFAERMATYGVRLHNLDLTRNGVMAVGALEASEDEREQLLVLPVLWDAATRLGTSASELFLGCADELGMGEDSLLRSFCTRSPENQTLACMGYRTKDDGEGFRYERTW